MRGSECPAQTWIFSRDVPCIASCEQNVRRSEYQVAGAEGLAKLLGFLEELPLQRVDVTDALINQAAILKGTFRLSVADAWILATAKSTGATLVHKDPEFEQARAQVTLQALPDKRPLSI